MWWWTCWGRELPLTHGTISHRKWLCVRGTKFLSYQVCGRHLCIQRVLSRLLFSPQQNKRARHPATTTTTTTARIKMKIAREQKEITTTTKIILKMKPKWNGWEKEEDADADADEDEARAQWKLLRPPCLAKSLTRSLRKLGLRKQ